MYAGVTGFVQGWIAARVWLPWFISVIGWHDRELQPGMW
jgi:hypothetical protein